MIFYWKLFTGLAALIFCGTSVVFTVGLWISIPAEQAGQWVAGLTALALELCKFSFAPLGFWLWGNQRFIGGVLLLLFPFLVIISTAATVGFLESHTMEQQQASAVNSVEYQALQQQLNSYSQRINNINGIVADYAASDYRKVAVKTDKRLDELEAGRDKTLAQLKSVQGTTSESAQAAFAGLANLTRTDADKLQHSAFLALAIITDLVGLVALLAFNSALTVKRETASLLNEQAPVQQTERESNKENKQPSKANNIELTEEQQQLARCIAEGKYGEKPVMRNINQEVKGGNNVVKPVFNYLEQIGVLLRTSRGFALRAAQ
ncbi:hypothetical protein [uncultured Microbulbifer sp.]|uniref:hypothetical protein n=1 Tax=uncultured Microbulbifer sp. TaxID=348147 RepID=UPI002636F040|nr:hypothetical protein [uncultured Microbulbifer sp.]